MLFHVNASCNFVLRIYYSNTNNKTKKIKAMMLTDKELEYLKDLENNKEVVYLLNTRECELIAKLIRSYKEIQRQLSALQVNRD